MLNLNLSKKKKYPSELRNIWHFILLGGKKNLDIFERLRNKMLRLCSNWKTINQSINTMTAHPEVFYFTTSYFLSIYSYAENPKKTLLFSLTTTNHSSATLLWSASRRFVFLSRVNIKQSAKTRTVPTRRRFTDSFREILNNLRTENATISTTRRFRC